MADSFGAKASQPGFDVLTAKDTDLLFSSSWPLLKVHYAGRKRITDTGVSQVLYTHNLGYVPMFWVYIVSTTTRHTSYGFVDNGQVAASTTDIKFFTYGGAGTTNYDVYIYIFRTPLTTNFEAPVINNVDTDSSNVDHNYGIKATIEGADYTSTDYRDFVLHSSTKSPLIHAVKTSGLTQPGYSYAKMFSYDHNLGYIPLTFCYVNYGANGVGFYDSSYWYPVGGASGVSDTLMVSQANTIRVEDTTYNPSTITATFVVLKDPFYQTQTDVTY